MEPAGVVWRQDTNSNTQKNKNTDTNTNTNTEQCAKGKDCSKSWVLVGVEPAGLVWRPASKCLQHPCVPPSSQWCCALVLPSQWYAINASNPPPCVHWVALTVV